MATTNINYQDLFKVLPERYLLFLPDDPNFTIIDASDGYLAMADRERGEAIGHPFFEIFPDTSSKFIKKGVSELAKSFRRVIKSGQPDSPEMIRYDNAATDGSSATHYWRPTQRPIFDANGKLQYILQSCDDVTQQKQLQDNLNFLLQASKALASSLDDATVLKNIARLAVPSMADWCAVDLLDAKKGLRQVAIIHKNPDRLARAKAYREQQGVDINASGGVPNVVRTGTAEFYPDIGKLHLPAAQQKRIIKISKELDIRSVIITPLLVDRKVIGAITLVHGYASSIYSPADLELAQEISARASLAMTNARLYGNTENELEKRKKLQAKLKQANRRLEKRVQQRTDQLETTNQRLERSNQELQNFAFVASHDLQEPLRKIQAFGNLLEDEFADQLAGGRDYLDRMRGAAARMNVLIEDLLSFSRVATKAKPFKKVNLNIVVNEVVSDLETRLLETKGRVELAKLPIILADATQMRQLLQNLIANALKFSRPNIVHPIVKIYSTTITSKNDIITGYKLFVEDNGIGFDEKYVEKIFVVFQRLHGRQEYEGTGIGLAVCRKIVERHGGEITARSTPGKGTTFIISLPVQPPKLEIKEI